MRAVEIPHVLDEGEEVIGVGEDGREADEGGGEGRLREQPRGPSRRGEDKRAAAESEGGAELVAMAPLRSDNAMGEGLAHPARPRACRRWRGATKLAGPIARASSSRRGRAWGWGRK
jgi:hypothetical protein